MAALLVMLAVMSVLMTAALPAWRFQAKREKELELIFRGTQYARAIALYRSRNQGAFPPSIDVLVNGRFIRKKFKDPMTKDGEFQPLFAGMNPAGQQGTAPTAPQSAGMIGVVSKSKDSSIIVHKGRTKYNEWQFVYADIRSRPGGFEGAGVPGVGGGRGGQPQPGTPGVGPGGRGGRGGHGMPGMPGPGRGGPFGGRIGQGSVIRGPGQ